MSSYRIAVLLFLAIAGFASLLESCRKKEMHYTTPVTLTVPPGFPQPQANFSNNPLTEEGIALGRHLFYEGKLSKDGNYPCASCHQPVAAFGTYDHDLSHGYNNSHTIRNAPALFNLAWQKEFGLDGAYKTIEQQIVSHITAQDEMAETVEGVVAKLKEDAAYKERFKNAFGDDNINSDRMLKALAQFLFTMVSANSKYDKVKRGEANFDMYEQRGYALYQANCATCHAEPLFTDLSYRNNGLAYHAFLKDAGRMRVTKNVSDSLKFKVPSLRNLSFSFPFMHDGRLYYLEQCLDHYSTGIVQSPTLDPVLKNGIHFTRSEEVDILAFLQTLADTAFVKSPQFSKP